MKKTAQQLAQQVKREPQEILKSAAKQVGVQGERKGEEQVAGEGFKESSARIEKLGQQDKAFQDKAIPALREKLGISAASGRTSKPKKPKTQGKAPAIPSEYQKSLKQQIARLRREVEEREAKEKAAQAQETEKRKKEEEARKQELPIPPSRRPEKLAPWARKIKATQGPGERRPSFGKQ